MLKLIEKEEVKYSNRRISYKDKYIRHFTGDMKVYECKDCGNLYNTYTEVWRHGISHDRVSHR